MKVTTLSTNSNGAKDHQHDAGETEPAQLGKSTDLRRMHGDEGLDNLHEAVKFYLGGALGLPPLEGSSPGRILDIGTGSGAWAVQAAEQFPEADVVAIDLSPLPSRPLPPNLRFQIIDMTKPFPFRPQTFDIVHSRFFFHYLTNVEDVLDRTMRLVKPGGWLLLDEVEFREDDGVGPGQNGFWKEFQLTMMGKDSTPGAGSKFQCILEASGLFSQVNVRKLVVPISKCDEPLIDIRLRRIGDAFRTMLTRVLLEAKGKVDVNQLDPKAIDAAKEEMNNQSRDMEVDVYMTWSRRRDW